MTNAPFTAQLEAARTAAVVVPLRDLIQIRVTGRDRSSFLHNFCTQDINGLPTGRCAEAFFTNVKARVIAHGWILADGEEHHIWMLPGNEDAFVNHLNRYIITEDVTIESQTEQRTAMACIGPDAGSIFGGAGEANSFGVADLDGHPVRWSQIRWADLPIILVTTDETSSGGVHETLTRSALPADIGVFERLRIEERFPRVQIDIGDDHLAPEARRDATAISYTKGCYLGQEPIARLDALGQINRFLARLEISDEPGTSDSPVVLTSYDDAATPGIGLSFVRSKDAANDDIVVQLPGGTLRTATAG